MFLLKTKVWLPVGWSTSVVFEFQNDSTECIPVWLIQIKCSWAGSVMLNLNDPHREVSQLYGNLCFVSYQTWFSWPATLCQKSILAGDQFRLLCVCMNELIKLHPALSSRYLRGAQASFVSMTWDLITTSWSSNNQAQCLGFHTLSSRP